MKLDITAYESKMKKTIEVYQDNLDISLCHDSD